MGKITFSWALDKNKVRIPISKAVSGANGYYCEGCKSEMEACIGNVVRPYFRHHSKEGLNDERECTWSNELARHAVGKDILQMDKQIKVPSLYIEVPPEFRSLQDKDELVRIKGSQIIQAHSVLKEKYVYENEFGEVKYASGDRKEIEERYLSVKPDVIFLDRNGKIILLVELCATHKVDNEKRAKLFRLGIDAVEVKIPKTHDPAEIGKNFKITSNTKWLYNHEQATTKFNQDTHLAGRESKRAIMDRGEFPPTETFECRAFRIKEVIRTITRLLGESEFNERRSAIEGEINRIEQAQERIRERLTGLNSRAEAEARISIAGLEEFEQQQKESLRQQDIKLTEQENELAEQEITESKRYRNLEGRYIAAKKELRERGQESDRFGSEISDRVFEFNGSLEREERSLIKGFSDEEDAIRDRFAKKSTELNQSIREKNQEIGEIERFRSSVGERKGTLDRATRRAKLDLESEIGNLTRERGNLEEAKKRTRGLRMVKEQCSAIQDEAIQRRPNKRK